jgi:LysW-gamma-L-lysine carboxypeptidase
MPDDAIALLEGLVRIPSPSRSESGAVVFLADWLRAHGFVAGPDDAGNLVATRGDGPREILLLGHIDTFPGEVPVRREGDRLFGRGTVDAKGPLCAFAAAAAATPPPDGWRVTVVGAVEEESWTSRGTRSLVAAWDRPPPAAVVVGEPSRWDRVTLGYRGSIELLVSLRAPFAHAAGRERLPAERAVDLWHAVERFCDERNTGRGAREYDRLSAALRALRTRDDGAHGVAQLRINLRIPLHERLAAVQQALRRHLRADANDVPGVEIRVRFRGGQEAFQAAKGTPLVAAFLRAIRAERGEPTFVVKTGTADLTIVGPAWPGVPMAVYGPGDAALDHTPDEHLSLGEYDRAIEVLARVLRDLYARPLAQANSSVSEEE